MKKIISLIISLLLLIISFVSADELNDCPGVIRTIEGSLFLAEGEKWDMVKPLPGIMLEIQSSCGNSYPNIVTNSEGKFSVQVKGPVSVCIPKGSNYFGACHYLHNKNNDASSMRVKEGKEVAVKVLNSQFNSFPKAINILQCSGEEVYTFTGLNIYLTKEMGLCNFMVHDNKKLYTGQIDTANVADQIEINLNQNVKLGNLPSLKASTGESVITMYKGWNLMPHSAFGGQKSTCFYNENEKSLVSYDILNKKYVTIPLEPYYEHYCDSNENQCNVNMEQLMASLQFGSSWFYTPINCQVISDSTENKGVDESLLKEGWNFRYVTKKMVQKSLEQIKGNCEIGSAYYFNGESQSWQKIKLNEELSYFGQGFIVKVNKDCELGFSGASGGPPAIPN